MAVVYRRVTPVTVVLVSRTAAASDQSKHTIYIFYRQQSDSSPQVSSTHHQWIETFGFLSSFRLQDVSGSAGVTHSGVKTVLHLQECHPGHLLCL